MKKDYYSYAKLELLDNARVQVACNEYITLEERTSIIKDIDEEYIQTINETEGVEFKAARDMIGDISSSYSTKDATGIIMQKLFNESYAFQSEIYDFVETSDFVEIFYDATAFNEAEELTFDDVYDEIISKAKSIAEKANETDFEM